MEKTNEDINLNDSLNTDKFKLVFNELKSMEILCKTAPLPGVSSSPQEISNPYNKIYVQSQKVSYDPLNISFRVDKNMKAYIEIYEWFRAIHSPQDHEGFKRFQAEHKLSSDQGTQFAVNASLFSLTNSYNGNVEILFHNIFPISLSGIDFNIDVNQVFVSNASFQYDYYTVRQKRS